MALVTCENCGTVQEYSIFEGTTPCRACGASADSLSPVAEKGSSDEADSEPAGNAGDMNDASAAASTDDANDASAADANATTDITVLIAEDDEAFRETISRWSTIQDGWDVRTAPNGRAALEAADDAVDVLVIDRRMPGLSGSELVERLEDTSFDGDILVVSAYESDDDLNESDVDGYVTKPVSRQAYIAALQWIATA
ncbi:MAG: response regulator transcription factor [Halopenitus sp.]